MGADSSSAPEPAAAALATPNVPEAGTSTDDTRYPTQTLDPASDDETASNVTATDLMAPEAIEDLLGIGAAEDDAESGEAVLA